MTYHQYDTIPSLEQNYYLKRRRTSCTRPHHVAPCDRYCSQLCKQCNKKKSDCSCQAHKNKPKKWPTFRDVLLSLVNEQIEVTTPFGIITGTLIAVREDYIVLIEDIGDQVHVQISKIELVTET